MGFALFRHDPYYLITITIIQLVFSLGCTSISLIFSPFNGFLPAFLVFLISNWLIRERCVETICFPRINFILPIVGYNGLAGGRNGD